MCIRDRTNDKKLDQINDLPVAPVFTEAIARIYEETSVSTLFLSLIHI